MKEIHNVVELVHMVMCKKCHAKNMEELTNRGEDICYYNLEDVLVDTWRQPDHVKWIEQASLLEKDLNFETSKEFLEFIVKIINISTELHNLTEGIETREDFISQLYSINPPE